MTTNLQEIKNTTKLIARAVRVTDTNGLHIAIHPFIESIWGYHGRTIKKRLFGLWNDLKRENLASINF